MDKNITGIKTEEFVAIKSGSTFGTNCLVRSHSVIYSGNKIGNDFQTGHGVLVRENNKIGDNVNIGSHTVIEHDVVIGDNCRIHSNAFIPEFTVLEDGVWIGPCVVITNAKYPNSPNAKKNLKGVVIKQKAKIGAGAVILPGVVVGKGSLVGAGAVVTENVNAGTVVIGNPARFVKMVSEIKDYNKDAYEK